MSSNVRRLALGWHKTIKYGISIDKSKLLVVHRRSLATVPFYFLEAKSGDKILVQGVEGSTVLDTALKHDIDIEGACGGELACSTCHVILDKDLFNELPGMTEEEQDMLGKYFMLNSQMT